MTASRGVVNAATGHVKHGTAILTGSLTGTHSIGLLEATRWEMTLELGSAALPDPEGRQVARIDVSGPGPRVKTMITDASGIDAAPFVGPDDGRRHWTLEHLRILQLLMNDRLIVVPSRVDLIDSN